ncbi:MAG TPA: hypothetical protein VFR24_27805, partial [Candidatus Angelobacter sp.]|nr:hypothetical protein [Candidatus Angelobacter sp.]
VGDSLGKGWKRGQAQRNAEAQHNEGFPDHQGVLLSLFEQKGRSPRGKKLYSQNRFNKFY